MTYKILGLCLLLPACAIAQGEPAIGTPAGWAWGVEASDYRYEEPSLGMSLDGQQIGGQLSYTQVNDQNVFGRIELRAAYGQLTYQGSGVAKDQPNFIAEARYVGGADFFPGDSVALSPYIGFGYRYLFSDLRGTTSTDAVGYRRYSYYSYVPLGMTLRLRTGAGWVIAPTVEYDHLIRGRQHSELSDTGILGFGNAENEQRNGYGYRASLRFETPTIHFGPWFNVWRITNSDITAIGPGFIGREPANRTREWGLEFGMAF